MCAFRDAGLAFAERAADLAQFGESSRIGHGMAKAKKGVKKFQKKLAAGGGHKKKKLHFKRDKAAAAKAAEEHRPTANPRLEASGELFNMLDPRKLVCSLHQSSKVSVAPSLSHKVICKGVA